MTNVDLLPPVRPARNGAELSLLHLVGLVDWRPPERDATTLTTTRPGHWVPTEVGLSLLGDRPRP